MGSSTMNDIAVAKLSGLARWFLPDVPIGAESTDVWRNIITAGRSAEECQQLEAIAFDVVSSARFAMPSAEVRDSIKANVRMLLQAADAGSTGEVTNLTQTLRAKAE